MPHPKEIPYLTQHRYEHIKDFLKTDIKIKNKPIKNRLFLAPMAGLGHVAFRELVSYYGGFGLLFTGMCSARAVPHENPAISPVFRWRPEELPYTVCQIFGADPGSMARAARRIEKEGFFGVDLNFGCSAAAICKKGSGAALLKTPSVAAEIVSAVRQAVSIPVFVKFRTGWDDDPVKTCDMAKAFENAGADTLVFHPRVAPDRRARPPRWERISQVKQAVSIPVFGNGNVFELSDAHEMVSRTGCDGISIGRMAVAKPWLFASWTKNFVPEKNIHYTNANLIVTFLVKHYDERTAVKLFKKLVPYLAAGFTFGHSISKQLLNANSMEEIRKNIECVFAKEPETTIRPNLNLFI